MEIIILELIKSLLNGNIFTIYSFFFISAILQIVFPPYPSDFLIVFEGYLTTVSPRFGFFYILTVSVIGSIIGSLIVYWVGYKKGKDVLNNKHVLKFISKKHAKRAKKLFHKYGKYTLIMSKFIPGTNTIMILFSGVFRLKRYIFVTYIVFSTILQQVIYLLIGRAIGHNISHVNKFLSIFNTGGIIALIIVLLSGYIIYRCRKTKRTKKTKKPSEL